MALQAAMDGRRVLVLTIDPAKRLANALGLSSFGNEAHRVEIGSGDGELWAMMLDAQSTWDNLIERLAQDPKVKQRILNNRIYRYVANSLAGSQEYMATEKLHDIAKTGEYDLIVLDTPPVKNALDFLESPGRLIHFFDERILKWFLSPYQALRFGRRLLNGPHGRRLEASQRDFWSRISRRIGAVFRRLSGVVYKRFCDNATMRLLPSLKNQRHPSSRFLHPTNPVWMWLPFLNLNLNEEGFLEQGLLPINYIFVRFRNTTHQPTLVPLWTR